MYLRRRRKKQNCKVKPDMRRSSTEDMMEEAKLWTGREPRHGGPGEDEDEGHVGTAGGSETEACLGDDDETLGASSFASAPSLPIYMSMHRVRRLIMASIDDPYTLDQLSDPRMNVLIVRPLVERLFHPKDITIVYCLLANRLYFLRQQATSVHQAVNMARATLCELVATRVLRRFHEANPGPQGLLFLSHILVGAFDPFEGAPEAVEFEGRRQWAVQARGGLERKLTTLELAILSESKAFISSPGCQRVVNAVYEGRVIYTPLSFVDILPDHYKYHPISLYDPRKAPILNHYRLIVPRSRNFIEFVQFLVLMVLYFLAMLYRRSSNEVFEFLFCIYAAGWVLDEFAAVVEHGWEVHAQNLWSWLDVTFSAIYGAYVIARIYDVAAGHFPDGHGLHILPLAAPILLTRIAFNIAPDNIVLISLHAMMKDFLLLSFLACWCFMGFLLALQWLIDSNDNFNETPSWFTIGKWMLWIWFGLDGTGIEESVQFHIVLGPALMIGFAFLGNTLFLTILVAMLTNTFSKIIADETAEVQFRRAVLTFEGVKSDAIFAYPPPFNIFALATLLPLRFLVSPETFHRVNVALIRALNLPTLLLISLYERRQFSRRSGAKTGSSLLSWKFAGFSPHGDIQAVFETPPPPHVADLIEGLDKLGDEGASVAEEVMPRLSLDLGRPIRWKPKLRNGVQEHDDLPFS